jgi:hypothetical protein
MDDKTRMLPLSFKKNDRDRKLLEYIKSKSCKSAWIKDAMSEKMEKEEEIKKIQIKPQQKQTGIQFREDIM